MGINGASPVRCVHAVLRPARSVSRLADADTLLRGVTQATQGLPLDRDTIAQHPDRSP
jgi:hypothetical protein